MAIYIPPEIVNATPAEKAQLYNSLLSQGYSDAEIRQATGAPLDENWVMLQQLAAQQSAPAQNFSGLFSSGDALAAQAEEVLAASGKANDPRYADSIVGTFTKDGVIYNVQGDGSIQGIIESPTGSVLMAGFTPEGQQATEALDTRFEQTGLDRALGILANAAMAAGTGFALGPAGIGALSAPAAAAAGAGVTNFANTADLQDALKAAALAGGTAFGVGQLFGGSGPDIVTQEALDLTMADDIANLASQGLSPNQITDILSTGYGYPASVVAQEVSSILGSAVTSPAAVTVTGSSLGALSNVAPALSAAVPSVLPQVQVTGQTLQPEPAKLTTPEVIGAAIPAVVGGTTQQVNVTEQRVPKTEPDLAATIGAIVPGIVPAIPTATAPATERVEVTTKRDTPAGIDTSGLSAALPAVAPALTQTLPKPVEAPAKKEDSLFSGTDLLKLLTLLGGTAAAGNMGNTMAGTGGGSSLGTTTPQFGDDYYAAVQRYYNAYMPETPRNVAGPLQQWYENKYGA